ncbi:hypothetical protein MKW92_026366, partial [Papaver armeniacum]
MTTQIIIISTEACKGHQSHLMEVPEEVLGKMGVPPKTDVPIITFNNLADADGLIFGLIEAQFKDFLDTQGVESNHSVVHHGLIYIPIGLTFEAGIFEMVQVKCGSPYCAESFAGDGPRQPTERELGRAFHQGKYIVGIAKKL